MGEAILWFLIFGASLSILLISASLFINSAEKIGLWAGLSPYLIGAIILAMGTSLPELISSVISVLKNSSEIVTGNVVGSNICNILLVLGALPLFGQPVRLDLRTMKTDLIFLALSTLLVPILIWNLELGKIEAGILLFVFLTYLTVNLRDLKKIQSIGEFSTEKAQLKWYAFPTFFLSIVGVYFSADYTVQSVVKLGEIFKTGTEVIAITAVALGTSLPELVVSIVAIKKGKTDIAIGNIIGSNIFNILTVLSIPALIGTVVVPVSIRDFSAPFMVLATCLVYFFVWKKKLSPLWGIICLLLYLYFNIEIIFKFFFL